MAGFLFLETKRHICCGVFDTFTRGLIAHARFTIRSRRAFHADSVGLFDFVLSIGRAATTRDTDQRGIVMQSNPRLFLSVAIVALLATTATSMEHVKYGAMPTADGSIEIETTHAAPTVLAQFTRRRRCC
jgi:hypothetical protein